MKYVLLICDDERDARSNDDLAADPVLQAPEADQARRGAEIAAGHGYARRGCVEIRPVWE